MIQFLSFSETERTAELQALAGESMGWQPLSDRAYVHHGDKDATDCESILYVVGVPDIAFAGLNVLLLT